MPTPLTACFGVRSSSVGRGGSRGRSDLAVPISWQVVGYTLLFALSWPSASLPWRAMPARRSLRHHHAGQGHRSHHARATRPIARDQGRGGAACQGRPGPRLAGKRGEPRQRAPSACPLGQCSKSPEFGLGRAGCSYRQRRRRRSGSTSGKNQQPPPGAGQRRGADQVSGATAHSCKGRFRSGQKHLRSRFRKPARRGSAGGRADHSPAAARTTAAGPVSEARRDRGCPKCDGPGSGDRGGAKRGGSG